MLSQERSKRGWSQEDVAKKVGISSTAIGFIETGKRKPSYDVLVKLENIFRMGHRKLFAPADGEEKSQS